METNTIKLLQRRSNRGGLHEPPEGSSPRFYRWAVADVFTPKKSESCKLALITQQREQMHSEGCGYSCSGGSH